MDKEDVVSIYIHIYIYIKSSLGHYKEWNNAICGNMNGPRDDHTKWSSGHKEKDKYHMLSLIYGI